MSIEDVIIPVSGLGTRLYPITKVIEKTMLPLLNKPVIDYILDEAIAAGLKNFYIVINNNQYNIKRYLKETRKDLNIKYIIQKNLNGLGGAILLCKEYIKKDFCVMLGDEIILNRNSIQELISLYNKEDKHIIGLKKVKEKDKKKYGIVEVKNNFIIKGIEKPLEKVKGKHAVIGRYLFKQSIFELLEEDAFNNKEIGLSNVIFKNLNNDFLGYIIKGKRFDIGNIEDYYKTIKYIKKVSNRDL